MFCCFVNLHPLIFLFYLAVRAPRPKDSVAYEGEEEEEEEEEEASLACNHDVCSSQHHWYFRCCHLECQG